MFPWYSMGPHGFPWVPMGPHGSPWGPMGTHEDPWVPMGPHKESWVPMGPHGSPWVQGRLMAHGQGPARPWGPRGALPVRVRPCAPLGPQGRGGIWP